MSKLVWHFVTIWSIWLSSKGRVFYGKYAYYIGKGHGSTTNLDQIGHYH